MYGLKHYFDFPGIASMYRVCLLYKDFVGTATRQQATAVPFEQDLQMDGFFKAIVGSVINMSAMTQLQPAIDLSGFRLEDVFTDDEQECMVELRENPETFNTLVFRGWLSGHKTSVPIGGGEWPMSLTASCGLGQLKNQDFLPESGNTSIYAGRKTYLQILTICLQKTRLSLPFSVMCSFRARTDGDFVDILGLEVDVAAYYDEEQNAYDCSRVLNDILEKMNCIIFQEDGRWWILNQTDRGLATATYKNYSADGIYVNTTTYSPRKAISYDGNFNFMAGTTYRANPPKRQVEASISLRNVGKNLIKNGNFADRYMQTIPFIGAVLVMRNWEYTINWNLLEMKTQGIELGPAIAIPQTTELQEIWKGDNDLRYMEADAIPATIASVGYQKIKIKIKYVSYSDNGSYPICVFSVRLRNANGLECWLKKDGTWSLEHSYDTYLQTTDAPTEAMYDGQPIVVHTMDVEMRPGYEMVSDPIGGVLVESMHFILYRPSVKVVGSGQKVLVLDTRIDVYEDNQLTKITPLVVNEGVASSYEKETTTLITGTQTTPYSLSQVWMPGQEEAPMLWDTNPSSPAVFKSVFDIMLSQRAKQYSRNGLTFEGSLKVRSSDVKFRDTFSIDYLPSPRYFVPTRWKKNYRMSEVNNLVLDEIIL